MTRRPSLKRLERALAGLRNPDGTGLTTVSYGFVGNVHTDECWQRQKAGQPCNCNENAKGGES